MVMVIVVIAGVAAVCCTFLYGIRLYLRLKQQAIDEATEAREAMERLRRML